MIIVAYVLMVDQTTPWGNRFWEAYIGNGARYAVMQKGKVGYINGRGRLIIPISYNDGARYSHQGLILVKSGNLWGFIDHDGQMVIAAQYSWAKDFSDGLAVVSRKYPKKFLPFYGFINEKGDEVIPLQYMQARSFTSDGLAAVKKDLRWGYINTHGDLLITPVYEETGDFHQNMAAVKQNGKWGYINFAGRMMISLQFDEAGDFSDGIAPVKHNGLWGYIGLDGRFVVLPSYREAHALSEGLGLVKGYNQIGFVDKKGEIVFHRADWFEARDFYDGLAAVKVSSKVKRRSVGRWGYMDTQGRFVIAPQFDWAWEFNGGLARVGFEKNDIRRGYVNKGGHMIWDPADWQQSTYFRQSVLMAIGLGFLFYVFYLLNYLRQRKHSKSTTPTSQTSPAKPSGNSSAVA